MRTIERLKAEAREAATRRGHSLGRFRRGRFDHTAFALCTRCACGAYVDAHPLPNGIDISGEAVAIGCTAPEVRS